MAPSPEHPPTQRQIVPIAIAAAAKHTGVSPKTIRRYIAAGRLAAYRMGPRLIRVDLAEVDALLHRIPTVSGDAA
jgi:excisionase family DNA binding protein